MDLSVSVFLIVYGVFLFFFITYSLFNIYHLVRYGFADIALYMLVSIFSFGTIILVAASAFQMLSYDWSRSLPVDRGVEYFNNTLFPGV